MQSQGSKVLRTVTVVLAVLLLGFVVATAAGTFFGGTKIRPLFGMPEGGLHAHDDGDAAPPATP
ncbi:hypothetical protein BHS06_34385 [Myxococcus xanthus]|uniref:hypothetical protein n=1 Tax=Myxococcus xanthus TaxID=34 RepID=UPI00112979A3|nr:hypothetical protein [Myxococcus xanthus]QDE94363.1 hypothetical protein BHS06_34385 [Myxococcus xanthus]